MQKSFGKLLIFISVFAFLASWYIKTGESKDIRPYSTYDLLHASWDTYKEIYINDDGRVIDHSQEITTSEGQSYALLRAVYIDDKETFDIVYEWTRNNLKRKDNTLFSWKWGEQEDGTFGTIGESGENTASDADSDIALALILAYRRWGQDSYIQDARAIINDMWYVEVAEVNGKYYLTAGNWAQDKTKAVINPSYFSPYAYRLFAEVDTEHPWADLVDPAYELLTEVTRHNLGDENNVALPPDWFEINKNTGEISPSEALNTHYSYDAIRVPWRVYIDYVWFNEPRAKEYLNSLTFLTDKYESDGYLDSSYTHSGEVLYSGESPAMYSMALFPISIQNPELGEKLYEEKLLSLYTNDNNSFVENLGYFEENLLWFSISLYEGRMPLL